MTSTQYQLKAEKRTLMGKKTHQLRKAGLVPANISGKIEHPVAISLNTKEFQKMYSEAGETAVIYLQVGDEKKNRPTLIESVDYDAMSRKPLHVSFRQVDLKEKVTAMVPVELEGELEVQEATVNHMIQEIEVEALPTDFPEAFVIDLTKFTEIGQEFTVAQLKVDSTKLGIELEPDTVLVQIQELVQMAEEVEETPAPAEGEVAAEGAAPADGEAKTEEASSEAKAE